MSELNGTVATVNRVKGKGKASKPAVQGKRPMLAVASLRRPITIGMGVGIPCLSLSLSSIGGQLLSEGHAGLGTGALVLCAAVLSVSLSHLAAAVEDITASSRWQSWALALAIDASLVLGELAGVAGFNNWLVTVLMLAVTAASAVLNVWAFLRHK